MAIAPARLTIRAYGVGFGDCFLLTFHYAGNTGDRHMLIDFGSTQRPPKAKSNLMDAIAADIAGVVKGHLEVVVATHRHTDHISGFATDKDGKGPGNRIASLKPAMVIQPWTERPDAPTTWRGPKASLDPALTSSLALMSRVASVAKDESRFLSKKVRDEIQFIGADSVANQSAVRNLARMANKGEAVYAQYGTRLALGRLLPGVKIKVLGPPTLEQKAGIAKQAARNRDEYWHFHSFWSLRADTSALATTGGLFPDADVYNTSQFPPETRWFIGRLKRAKGEQLLRIVRAMDDALNNTSVILLIQAGSKKLLFPGDAQWENWEYALRKDASLLRNVNLYKVGHHGSLNATPKTLWNLFSKRGDQNKRGRLTTLVSTRTNSKHGHREDHTEVPRDTLIAALRRKSIFRSTQELENSGNLVLSVTFSL